MTGDLAEKNRTGLVFCVSGPSGAGKGTIIRKVLEMNPQIIHSVSVTTRQPRSGEQDGVDYHFCSHTEFLEMINRGDILEYDIYCENYYGTPRSNVEELVSRGVDVLMDITVPGSVSVMNNFPQAVTLFLMPPSFSELERRLSHRGTEDPETIRRRLDTARDEINKAKLFTYCIINDDITASAGSVLAIIQAEHCRYDRLKGLEKSILAL